MSFVWLSPQNFGSEMGSRNGFYFSSSFEDANLHLGLRDPGLRKEDRRTQVRELTCQGRLVGLLLPSVCLPRVTHRWQLRARVIICYWGIQIPRTINYSKGTGCSQPVWAGSSDGVLYWGHTLFPGMSLLKASTEPMLKASGYFNQRCFNKGSQCLPKKLTVP